MKFKTANMVIMLALFLAGIPFHQTPDTVQASPTMTTLKVEPPSIIDPSLTPGESFTVDINVSDVIDLFAWQVAMSWTPGLIELTSVTYGDFLPPGTKFSAPPNINNAEGWVGFGETTIGTTGIDGSGWLAAVAFQVASLGETVLNITDSVEVSPGIFVETLLRNSSFPDPQPIPFTPTNGYFSNLAVGEPPVASFTFSPASPLVDETVTFDASTSSDPDGTIVSWDWDFGDLATASGEIVTHSYSAADTYTVTLTVTDDDGLTDTTTQAVTVTTAPEPPVASFTYSPLSPVVGDMISFDASGSSDADGTIVSFEWNFGDSAAGTGVTAVHAYAAADTYTVTLTVTDDDGLTVTATDDVPVSPGAPIGPNFSISASPSSLAIQQGDSDVSAITVTSVEGFSDSVILSVSSLPSGATATLNPTTVTPPPYGFGNSALTLQVGLATVPGTYYLTVTGTNDTLEHSVEITLEIAERPPPYALFSHSPSEPRVNDTVAFDGSDSYDPDGTIESYEWDFGDKTIGIGKVTSHIYTKAGVYTVTLTVTNNDGTTGISTQPITIARLRSTISIAVSNTPIYVTDSVVINGTINPMRAEATVTVWCRLREEEAWNILTTVTTDENSEYSYTWTSSETGSYELKTSWTGDVDTLSAESSIENVDVNPLPVLSIGHAFFLLGVFSLACLLVVGCILVVWSLLKRRRNRTALTG